MARNKTKLPQHQPSKKHLPVWLVIGGLGVILLAAALLLGGKNTDRVNLEVSGAPRIKVDRELLDYGVVKLGGVPIRSVVKITNAGDQTLRFTKAPYIEVLEGC